MHFFILCFLCLIWRLLTFLAVLQVLGSPFEKNFGSELLFLGGVVVFVFSVGFCLCFCFIFVGSLPKVFGKILLMSGLVFFGVRSLFLCFFRRRRFSRFFFCLRETDQVVTGHPHTHLFACSFSLFVSRRACCFARFGRASRFSAFFSGCHSGPRAFLGFSWNLLGLSSLAPSEAFFLGREAARVFGASLVLVFFSPLLFCGHTFSRRPSR